MSGLQSHSLLADLRSRTFNIAEVPRSWCSTCSHQVRGTNETLPDPSRPSETLQASVQFNLSLVYPRGSPGTGSTGHLQCRSTRSLIPTVNYEVATISQPLILFKCLCKQCAFLKIFLFITVNQLPWCWVRFLITSRTHGAGVLLLPPGFPRLGCSGLNEVSVGEFNDSRDLFHQAQTWKPSERNTADATAGRIVSFCRKLLIGTIKDN